VKYSVVLFVKYVCGCFWGAALPSSFKHLVGHQKRNDVECQKYGMPIMKMLPSVTVFGNGTFKKI